MGLEKKQSGRGWGCARRFLWGGRAGRGGSTGKDYKKFSFYPDNNRGYFLPVTSHSQTHETEEMVLVEVTEDFAGCASGQHPTGPLF